MHTDFYDPISVFICVYPWLIFNGLPLMFITAEFLSLLVFASDSNLAFKRNMSKKHK